MIVALFALSAAMAVGGIVAVIQGFPFVRLESGLAMVIAGATVAAAGAVLAGLGVVAVGLRRIERAARPGPAPAARPQTDPAPAAPPPALRPSRPGPAAAAAGIPAGQRSEPAFRDPVFEKPHPAPASGAQAAPDPREPELPLPGLTPPVPLPAPLPPPLPEERPPEPAASAEDDLFARPETPAPQRAAPEADVAAEPVFTEPPLLRPALDAAPEPAEPATRAVVGRYASGGNTYVMFADGAIEAETPQGRFTFASLDELKAFVDGGGEAGTRGAA